MPAKHLFSCGNAPEMTIVIPSLDGARGGNLDRLLGDLLTQSYKPIEIVVSIGETPNGHARNVGIELASPSSKYYAFFDDDVRLGAPDVLENFVRSMQDLQIGLVGASQLPPDNSSWTQKWIAYDLSKAKFPVQDKIVDTEMATHAGMACRRVVWEHMGGESDHLITGTDTDLRDRLRANGFRVVVVPRTWVYHPLPTSFRAVLRAAIRNGRHQLAYRKKHGFQTAFLKPFKKVSSGVDLLIAIAREVLIFVPHVLLSNSSPKLGFRPLNALFRLFMVTAYSVAAYRDQRRSDL
jgi:glycosyltransferase involved in cell wall biosynthesis